MQKKQQATLFLLLIMLLLAATWVLFKICGENSALLYFADISSPALNFTAKSDSRWGTFKMHFEKPWFQYSVFWLIYMETKDIEYVCVSSLTIQSVDFLFVISGWGAAITWSNIYSGFHFFAHITVWKLSQPNCKFTFKFYSWLLVLYDLGQVYLKGGKKPFSLMSLVKF